MMIQDVFSAAGSNSLGCASIHSGSKAISTNCTHPMDSINALTIQNTQGVIGKYLVLPPSVLDQVNAVSADFQMNEGLVSMTINADIAQVVSDVLWPGTDVSIIMVLAMIAKVGAPLLADKAIAPVCDTLLPLAIILTPNIPEAAHFMGLPPVTTQKDILAHGRALCALRLRALLMKGGYLDSEESPDVLITDIGENWFNVPKVPTKNTHETRCILSAAITAQIAQSLNLPNATGTPKIYVAAEILQADQLYVGSGCASTHNFANLNSYRKLKYETDIFDHRLDPVCITTCSARSDDLDVGLVYQS